MVAEARVRRPHSATSLGRAGTVIDGADRFHGGAHSHPAPQDGESLIEEHGHLREHHAALKRENSELRERLRAAERESARKDKLLQELLAATKRGTGVPGEVLDQLREDLQTLLLYKRKVHEARLLLEEKEKKISAIHAELKVARIADMEEGVVNAKLLAKNKRDEWVEANSGEKDTHCFTEARKFQAKAAELAQQLMTLEGDASMQQQKLVNLQDDCKEFERAKEEHGEELSRLQTKRQEVEKQMAVCTEKLLRMSEVQEKHADLQRRRDEKRKELESLQHAHTKRLQQRTLQGGLRPGSAQRLEVSEELLHAPLAYRLQNSGAPEAAVLRKLRHTGQVAGCSLVEVLLAEDKNRDGHLAAAELSQALRTAKVPGADSRTGERILQAMRHNGKAPQEGAVSVLDLILSLPLQHLEAPMPLEEITQATEALTWACRRHHVPEKDMRDRIAGFLRIPNISFDTHVRKLCAELDLGPTPAPMPAVAEVLTRCLEEQRRSLALALGSWASLGSKDKDISVDEAVLVAIFTRDLASHKDALPLLIPDSVACPLEDFVQVASKLGSKWSPEELAQVALTVDKAIGAGGQKWVGDAPKVDCTTLRRAVRAFATELPAIAALVPPELVQSCNEASAARSRRSAPGRGGGGPASPPPPAKKPSPVVQKPPAAEGSNPTFAPAASSSPGPSVPSVGAGAAGSRASNSPAPAVVTQPSASGPTPNSAAQSPAAGMTFGPSPARVPEPAPPLPSTAPVEEDESYDDEFAEESIDEGGELS